MGLFGKKKTDAIKNSEDRDLIEFNSKSIKSLIILCDSEEFSSKLKRVEEDLKYLTPSVTKEVYKYDQKIKACIEDLKIALTKNSMPDVKANNLLKELVVLISDRNSNM